MFNCTKAFSSFSVNDFNNAKEFYSKTLGLNVSDVPEMEGLLNINLDNNKKVMVYSKTDHTPATFTVLNFPVKNVEEAVNELTGKGVKFEQYGGNIQTNEKGIFRSGDFAIAWFKDPAGNILSVLEDN